MKRKIIVVFLSLVLVLVFAQAAFAWGGGSPRTLSGNSWTNMADMLELSSEQAQTIQGIQENKWEVVKEQRDSMWQLKKELKSMQWQPGVEKEQVETKINELNELRQEMSEQRQQYHEKLRDQLTDEQLETLAENRNCSEFGQKHGPRGGRFGN